MNPTSTVDHETQLAEAAKSAANTAANALDHAGAQVGQMATNYAKRGADALRDGSQQLQARANQAVDTTTSYIKDDPVKAMLVAAATGAALMGLVGLLSGWGRRN
jgi:X-X-X-Leu-X-X-Gly heptad repeat protein